MLNVKGFLTSRYRGTYKQLPLTKIEAYQVESSLDTDADQFSADIAMTNGEWAHTLNRNSEVRVSLFTADEKRQVSYLNTGIADLVEFDAQSGLLSVNGRDFSCIADSQAPPDLHSAVRPSVFVGSEARAIGFSKVKLATAKTIKTFYRDGSETYWDSWYRIYRKSGMWLWTEPDGELRGDYLFNGSKPSYYFGSPRRGTPSYQWQQVTSLSVRASKQQRVEEVWVFGQTKKNIGFVGKAVDPTIKDWVRKPRKIFTSSSASNQKEAQLEAWEEIADGKVGALEITLTVPLTSRYIVKQNTMAMLHFPQHLIGGLFFVVGVSVSGSGSDGYVQTVRLREKGYAVSKRIPEDPEDDPDFLKTWDEVEGNIDALGTAVDDPSVTDKWGNVLSHSGIRWGNAFASAAKEFRGQWPYDIFLAVLLSICDHETGFNNFINGNTSFEHTPRPNSTQVDEWYDDWANEPGNSHLTGDAFKYGRAVGPMQLLTQAYKEWADEYGGVNDEYDGGRWQPEANIRAGARAFAEKLSGLDPTKDEQIWIGVSNYYGAPSAADRAKYVADVKNRYETKFKKKTASAIAQVEDEQQAIADAGRAAGGPVWAYTVKDAYGANFQVQIPRKTGADIRQVIAFCLAQLGEKYVWGAAGPDIWDCSGLVMKAYDEVGISLPHNTDQMWNAIKTRELTRDELLPGDLVWFGTQWNLHHIALMLNDDHVIHAPHTGDVVKISPLGDFRDYYGAKRLITN